MNKLFLLLFFILLACSSNKLVYWCGDHPCINNREKEAYFKKTMIVEVKQLNKKNMEESSEFNKLKEKAILNEKKRIKNDKAQAKLMRLEEKQKIKEKKRLDKLESKKKKEEKKMKKKDKTDDKPILESANFDIENTELNTASNTFDDFVKKITNENMSKKYPDINDVEK